jgi:hypothetical protein
MLNLTNLSINVIHEINKLRTNPLDYAKKLVTHAAFLSDDILLYDDITFKLSEKKQSFIDAIKFLEQQEKRSKMTLKIGINKCCEELMKVLIIHEGIENTNEFNTNRHFEWRMNKFGCAFGELDELIDFGNTTPESIVLNLLLCDGDPERKERHILFKEKLNFIGVFTEILPSEKICTIINLAEHYYDVGEDIPDSILKYYYPIVYEKLEQEKQRNLNNHYIRKNNYPSVSTPSINLNNSHHNYNIPTLNNNKDRNILSNENPPLNKSVNHSVLNNNNYADDSFRKMRGNGNGKRKNDSMNHDFEDYYLTENEGDFSNNSLQFRNETSKKF